MQKLRIHAIPLADDDGKRKYTFTLDNLTNQYAGQGYRLHQVQAYGNLYSAMWTKP